MKKLWKSKERDLGRVTYCDGSASICTAQLRAQDVRESIVDSHARFGGRIL